MAERNIVQAGESFSVTLPDGTPFVVVAGDRFWSDDPMVQNREHLFGEVTVRSSRPAPSTAAASETATAEPGARRVVSRSAKN